MEFPPSKKFFQGFPPEILFLRFGECPKITIVRVEVSKQVVGEVVGAAHRAERC